MKKDDMLCDCGVIHANIVDAVKIKMPDEEELYDLSDFFKILGDSTRAKIIWALDESEMCVCDLAVLLSMTKSAISHQLSSLKQANLVKNRREGKVVFYSLADDHIKDIFEKGLEHIREKNEDTDCVARITVLRRDNKTP
ncbi:MAG: metalloregulator ArsR/SmtB family transcription factor [Candidatus Saccharimonadaceae bacterium]|nr:metalloregulator ArsR/SmtB family transcription factor [Candidatus Saccharimonadaceae bacterium]